MKTRNGFVSNSSSSSFIIAYKTPTKCKCCGLTPPNIKDYLEHSSNEYSDNSITYEGKENVLEMLNDNLTYCKTRLKEYKKNGDKDGYAEDTKKEIKHLSNIIKRVGKLEEDYDIINVAISYHDNFGMELLNTPNIIVFKRGND